MEHARQRFALDKPDPTTGKSRLRVLYEILEQTRVVSQELQDLKSVPPEMVYLWDWYKALSDSRSAGFSVNAIAWSDIAAFFSLMKLSPTPWEVSTIRQIDQAFIASRADSTTGAVGNAAAMHNRMSSK